MGSVGPPGTDCSNPSPSSDDSANDRFRCAENRRERACARAALTDCCESDVRFSVCETPQKRHPVAQESGECRFRQGYLMKRAIALVGAVVVAAGLTACAPQPPTNDMTMY